MWQIKEINSKAEYDLGLEQIQRSDRHFLQAYEYGQLQKDLGHQPIYLGFYNGEKLQKSVLTIFFKAKRGSFLFCPYGVFNAEELKVLIPYLKNLAKKLKVDFLRFSPLMDDNQENLKMFAEHGFKNAPVHMMHPELDWSLDISKDEKTLLKEMRKNNRYGINKAKKDGVQIEVGATQEMLDIFYQLHEETAKRQGFVPWSKKFLDAQLKYFAPLGEIKVYLAKWEDKWIAGAVMMFYEGRSYYHHGASLSEYNKISASYLIQWQAIQEAKAAGFYEHSFYGVVDNAPKHPWAGLSFFKKGFGGKPRAILHCQDLKLSWKYWINFAVEKFRRWKKGY
ncbi:MAG: lipid II:glycine glycyltransferase FemX [Candidatus Altimarinota bacterium]